MIGNVKKIWLALVALALSFTLPSKLSAFSGIGAGTSGSPYRITNCTQLLEIDDALSAHYALTQDFSCDGILTDKLADGSAFTGTLDGRGHTISDIEITASGYAGLFEVSGTGAVIKNIHLRNGFVATGVSSYSGSFVGRAEGNLTISDSSSNLTNSGESPAGFVGLIQSGTTTIERSYFTGNLESDWIYSGGLVGAANGTLNISDSYTSGTYVGEDYTGGLVGYMNAGLITRSYSTADITANDGFVAGGLVGRITTGDVTNSFYAGTIGGTSTNIGAVFGLPVGDEFPSVYFDAYRAGTTDCGGGATCNAVNATNTTPNYFKNNSSNAPLNTWNFSGVWLTTANYPVHGVMPTSDSSSSPSSSGPSTWTCGMSAPSNAPDLFQINATRNSATLYFAPANKSNQYFISYGLKPGDQQFGVEFPVTNNNGVQSYTIGFLSPNTEYYFTVRGGNGCMPGGWSNTMRARTPRIGQTIFYR